MLSGSWYLVSCMLDDFTNQKINMLGTDFKRVLLEYIAPECLEERFGGTCPNKESGFFPPDLEIPGHKMMTKSEYLAKSGQPVEDEGEFYWAVFVYILFYTL